MGLALASPPPTPAASGTALARSDEVHTHIYRQLASAVVGITCKRKDQRPDEPGEFFGTGTVVSPNGLILTATTVVPEDGENIKVYFVDGRVMPAEIRQVDKATEGVLLRIKAEKLTCMKLADSSTCKVGDPAYSWGNPFHTIMKDGMVSLSTGTISGIYDLSSVDDESRYVGPVLETDAALNPGSDGGPLTDADGNLIGIQSLAFSRTRWLGEVIPVHRVAANMPELKAVGLTAKVSFDAAQSRAWAIERAMPKAVENVAAATVSIRVVYEGSKAKIPDRRADDKLETLAPYPRDARRNMRELMRPADAYASGVIVEPEGIVVTSAYNLSEPAGKKAKVKAIYVFLADGARVEAKLLGQDSFYDLAVLQLPGEAGKTYDSAPLASNGHLTTGKYVAVLGRSESPGSLTLNSGPVSATNRYQGSCSQINTMVNYGNLGGPVVDLRGQLVGLTVRLTERTPWRQNCGVAFMLNADTLRTILPDLKAGKKLEPPLRPYLGVEGDIGALDIKGARINRVRNGSPAEAAGIKNKDVIVKFNGVAVEDWPGLVRAIQSAKVDQTVKVKLRRGDQEVEVEVTLGKME
jgi:S1-C subfamily serine protease